MVKSRIFLAGVGGQGTLTATNLLALLALDKDIPVTSGEIHGMAQRGGIVESTVLLGGYLSPKIGPAEADILLGFEPLETLRALPYLKPGGLIVSNTEPTMPVGVSLGNDAYPELERIQTACTNCTDRSYFLACKSLASQAGTAQSANMVLLGGLSGLEGSFYDLEELQQSLQRHLPEKIIPVNLDASRLGNEAIHAG